MNYITSKTTRSAFALSAGTLMIFLATSSSFAQPAGRMQMDPGERVEQMLLAIDEHVDITDEQADQLRPILLEEGERRREVSEQLGRSNREAVRAAMDAIRAETNQRVREILTEEQMTKYVEWQQSRSRGPRQGRRLGGRGGQ